MDEERNILHVDMDAFYASVEQLDDPRLLGKPVIVGGDPQGRGVVSAASYEARRFGVHSAMPMRQAIKRCPEAHIQPVRMRRYVCLSQIIHRIFADFTPLVEPLSLDEAFLDVTGSNRLFGSAEMIGRTIKKRIYDETGLIASVGVAPNKFLAKLASDLDKPDGFVVITSDNFQQILDPLPIRRMWGVGKVSEKHLLACGYRTFKDLRLEKLDRLQQAVGNQASVLQGLAQGCDNRPVEPSHEAKSISSEQTFATDQADPHYLKQILLEETERVTARLRLQSLFARTVTLKVRYGDFRTLTRRTTLSQSTDVTEEIWTVARQLFTTWQKQAFAPLRLIGMGVSGLSSTQGQQLELFSDPQNKQQKQIDKVMDQVRERYGRKGLHRVTD